MKNIGIVGAGTFGSILARRLVQAGHRVRIANSRGPETLRRIEIETGALAVDILDAATGADILILSIPLGRMGELPRRIFDRMSDDIAVIDTSNYVPARDGTIADIEAGMPETAWTSIQVGRPLVKALNSISELSLEHRGQASGRKGRIALPVSGDHAEHRAAALRLVEDLGFDGLDTGPLEDSWRQQLGTPAYATDPDERQLIRLRARADLDSLGRKRDEAMQLMRKLPADFPKAELLQVARLMAGLDQGRIRSWMALGKLGLALLPRA
ncbi:NAD(P)-binding domain-containing protein [Mitsuaria sp. CC2]|uniref:NADPH-dependent F420 reductase n=1 Tax=Mitsuaria sp. CC2 TaxID=3029186 RepID=UPI003B8CB2B5